ncbi:MAG: signal peptidase I [Eubacteriales bacterium]|nr:signal peptidase I [Eubacteriales bacterium]
MKKVGNKMNYESKRLKQKKVSSLRRRALLVLFGLLLGLNAYFANAETLIGNQLPMPFGYGAAVVLSGSMEPTFSRGDLIFVREAGKIEAGDIVVYQSDRELIVHRVMSVDNNIVVTKGDANNAEDPPFDQSDVKGIVIGWIPRVGNVVNALKSPAGTMMIIICALLLIECSFRKQKEKDEADLDAIKEEIRRLKELPDKDEKEK